MAARRDAGRLYVKLLNMTLNLIAFKYGTTSYGIFTGQFVHRRVSVENSRYIVLEAGYFFIPQGFAI